MSNIQDFSDEDLRKELERRAQEADLAAQPKQVDDPDLSGLRQVCQDHVDCIFDNGYENEDDEHFIYEAAMSAIFGPGVFNWVNEKLS